MRNPSSTLVVDAAVLISTVFGRSVGAFAEAQRKAVLVTTDRVVHEARRRIEFGLKRPDLLDLLDELVKGLVIFPVAAMEHLLPRCEVVLRDAVPSRNGSMRDAHVLALAWSAEADIWTADRDFAGTGIASWSTPNLMRGFAEAEVKD